MQVRSAVCVYVCVYWYLCGMCVYMDRWCVYICGVCGVYAFVVYVCVCVCMHGLCSMLECVYLWCLAGVCICGRCLFVSLVCVHVHTHGQPWRGHPAHSGAHPQ